MGGRRIVGLGIESGPRSSMLPSSGASGPSTSVNSPPTQDAHSQVEIPSPAPSSIAAGQQLPTWGYELYRIEGVELSETKALIRIVKSYVMSFTQTYVSFRSSSFDRQIQTSPVTGLTRIGSPAPYRLLPQK